MPTNLNQLNDALRYSMSGDIYKLKKCIKAGVDTSEKHYLCITEAARIGQTHIVQYLLETQRPTNSVLKKLSTICADNITNQTLKLLVKTTGVYSAQAQNAAEYAGNTPAVDYLMDRELYQNIGKFYKQYHRSPQRIKKLLCYEHRKYKNGEPEPVAFTGQNQDVLTTLKGIIYKTELKTMLQIACRERLKDAADILYLATEIARGKNIGITDWRILQDEAKNSKLTYTVSFGTFEDYLQIKKEGTFLGSDIQKNNLGYTLCLAIKNKNYKIAQDLIRSGYCPIPQNAQDKENLDKFNSILNNLTHSSNQKECSELLKLILNQPQPINNQKDSIKVSQLLAQKEMQKFTWGSTLKAINTGKEEIAKVLLKCIDLKELDKKKYYNSVIPPYSLTWLVDYKNKEMIKEISRNSPEIAI